MRLLTTRARRAAAARAVAAARSACDARCRRLQDVAAAITAWAPEGITAYFDNVGGAVTDAVLTTFQNEGRFALCGSISEARADAIAAPHAPLARRDSPRRRPARAQYDDKWSGQRNFNMILMRYERARCGVPLPGMCVCLPLEAAPLLLRCVAGAFP